MQSVLRRTLLKRVDSLSMSEAEVRVFLSGRVAFYLAMGASILAAQSIDTVIRFPVPTQVGTAKLEPAAYELKLQGSLLILTDKESKRSYTTVVKVEKLDSKSTATAAMGEMQDGVEIVTFIQQKGAGYRLVFASK